VGRTALIDSLREKAAEDAEAAWTAVRDEADGLRAGFSAALDQERTRLSGLAGAEARRRGEQQLAEARRQARALRMEAAVRLAAQLRQLAEEELPALGRQGGEQLFKQLAGELPPRSWENVRVHPADATLAQARFPDAGLTSDDSISGGLEVTAEDGRVRLANTLEARLDAAWPDLLPELVAEVFATAGEHGSAA